MFRKQWIARTVWVLVILSTLTACAGASTTTPTEMPQPTLNLPATLSAVQTQAVKDFSKNLTQNAPTATQILPTKTIAVTATPAVTNTPLPPLASATATVKPQPVGPTRTPVVNCQIIQAYPSASDTITPGASFTARWVIVNTGTTTWKKTTYEVNYWSGMRFENQAKIALPFDVAQNDNITIVIASMIAPTAPGTYNSVWAVMIGFQPYCLMPITIVLPK